jgi:hypothetical protein
MPREPTIFIQIASYRDPECQWTVKDLFDKAEYPDRVSVGICAQCFPDQDRDCFIEPSPRPEQTKIISVLPSESLGVCWARAKTQTLFEDQDYVLMIDSHMRFIPGWDTALIAELARCNSPKPFLSNYPPSYKPPNQLNPSPQSIVMRAKPFNEQGDVRFDGEALASHPSMPLRGAFLAAGFIFAAGKFVREVPYDPYMYFDHEEVTIAVRAYTHGWDVFSPPGVFVYHYYYEPDKGEKRALHWSDNRDWAHLLNISRARCNYLLAGITPVGHPEALKDITKYGLGSVRTIEEFQTFSGIDFKKKTVSARATQSQFIEGLDQYRRGTILPLKVGDIMPPFKTRDSTGVWLDNRDFNGKSRFLCILPSNFDIYIKEFLEFCRLKHDEFLKRGFQLVLIPPLEGEAADFYRELKIADKVHDTPFSYLLDVHGKISGLYNNSNAENHIHELLSAVRQSS